MVRNGVVTLAIHDLPLIRTLVPRFDDLVVHSAYALAPFGFQIVLTAGAKRIELHATMPANPWRPEWVLEAYSDDQALRVEFSPSFVQAGSAVATLHTAESSQTWGPAPSNGYEGEWRALAAIARGRQTPPSIEDLIDDLRFALAIGDASADVVRAHGRAGPMA